MEVTPKPRKIAPNTPKIVLSSETITQKGTIGTGGPFTFLQSPSNSHLKQGQPVILKSPSGKQLMAYPYQSGGTPTGGSAPFTLAPGSFAPQIIQSGDQKFLLTQTPNGPKLIPITTINSGSQLQPQQHHQQQVVINTKIQPQLLSPTTPPTTSFVFPSDSILAPNPTPTTPLNFSKQQFTTPLLNHSIRKRVEFPTDLSFDGSNKRSKRGDGKGGTGKGLRHFSLKVCEKVRAKGVTTYNEVADELVNEFASESGSLTPLEAQFDQKNIRRRVYDALNVLMAMDIISKEKKEIKWLGLPTNSLQESTTLQNQRTEQLARMKTKTEHLHDLIVQLVAFKSLVQRNKENEALSGPPPPNGSIHLPFLITSTAKNTIIDCSISNDKMEYLFNFNGTFEIHDDIEVLKRMGLALGLDKGDCTDAEMEQAKLLLPRELGNYVDQIARKSDDWSKEFDLGERELDSLFNNTEGQGFDSKLFGLGNGGGSNFPMDLDIQAAIDSLGNGNGEVEDEQDDLYEDEHDGYDEEDSNDV